ncbi:hypothetical protein K9M41_03180 [Candidatus Gracilibacteria bacterium]|nr:hypothetical protein [Candidatus Gracilibacteria bacterium]
MKKLIIILGLFLSSTTFAMGDLEVSSWQFSGVVPKNGIRIPFLTIQVTARNEEVQISEITVRRNGLSESSDISRLIAITDKFRRSLRTSFNNDDLATLKFRNPLVLTPNETHKITIYGNLNITATSGRTIALSLENITSSANNISQPSVEETFQEYQKRTIPKRANRWRIKCVNRKCQRILE